MKRRFPVLPGLAMLIAISLFCTACQKGSTVTVDAGSQIESSAAIDSDSQAESTAAIDSDSQTENSAAIDSDSQAESTSASDSDSQTENTSASDSDSQAESTSASDSDWEIAKMSGSETDFEKYFDVNVDQYMKGIDHSGTLETITYHSEVMSADREAYVYLPYGYDESRTYPVVYLIHGIGCDGTQWTSMSATRLFDNLIDAGTINPCIAVFPSVIPADGIDPNTLSQVNVDAFSLFVDEFAEDLVPYLQEHYSISDAREDTAVCGLSMGGMEALRLGFTYLDRFAFIGSFSAAPTLETELLTTEGSSYIPELVLLCSGDKDTTVGDSPKNYHLQLVQNNVDHIWYQHPGQNHSPTVWKLGLYNFLTRLSGGFTD